MSSALRRELPATAWSAPEDAINTLVALNITGPGIQKSGEITNLSVQEPLSASGQNVSLIFNNTGNIHYKILTK